MFRSFIEYFEAHRFRLHTMLNPAIVFVLRELIVKLYGQESIPWQTLMAFGLVILCLGAVRALAVHFSLEDLLYTRKTMVYSLKESLTNEERKFLISVKKGKPEWDLLGLTGVEDLYCLS